MIPSHPAIASGWYVRSRARRAAPTLLLLLLLAGCDDAEEASGTIPRERFITANVALREIEPASADAAARRREALRELGVTEAELREWVTVNRRDTEGLAETWEEIAERIERADSGRASTDSAVSGGENR